MNTDDRLARLSAAGVSIWLDDLSRERLASGNLRDLIEHDHVVGVTTNPTIFAGALAHGQSYDEQLRELARRGVAADAAVREITTTDVRIACDLFRETWEATDHLDGRVSIEVDPRLAYDADRTATEAHELWKIVDRPNLLVKIPATRAGLPAITRALGQGISVNVTLIFSVARYREVMAAFLDGLELARANGHNLAEIASVASFFVSRVDTEVDKRLGALATAEANALRGQAGIANARLAYEAFERVIDTPRWGRLRDVGASPQRPLWASTGVKDPSYSDTRYVDELVTSGVVNTMPEKTLRAVADHGKIEGDTVRGAIPMARDVFRALSEVGVDIDDVFRVLEQEGVDKFDASWSDLQQTVEVQLNAAKG